MCPAPSDIRCTRKAGNVSVPGVYGGFLDKIPFGAAMNKGLTFKMGQTHMQKYMPQLLKLIEEARLPLLRRHPWRALEQGGQDLPDVHRKAG